MAWSLWASFFRLIRFGCCIIQEKNQFSIWYTNFAFLFVHAGRVSRMHIFRTDFYCKYWRIQSKSAVNSGCNKDEEKNHFFLSSARYMAFESFRYIYKNKFFFVVLGDVTKERRNKNEHIHIQYQQQKNY